MPRISPISASICAWSASSATYAVMDTSFSMEDTRWLMTVPPTKNTPMISSERKMVTMEPSVVDRLRVKPWMDSLRT